MKGMRHRDKNSRKDSEQILSCRPGSYYLECIPTE